MALLVAVLVMIGGLIAMGVIAYWLSLIPPWFVRLGAWIMACLITAFVIAVAIKGAV